jgi:hypothetical protein
MDIEELGCEVMDWINLAQVSDRCRTLVNTAMHLRLPWKAGTFLDSCATISFSIGLLFYGVSQLVVVPFI